MNQAWIRPFVVLSVYCGFLLALYCAAIGSVRAEPAPLSAKGYYVDPTGQQSVDQASQQSFAPFAGALSLGYTASTVWLRVHVDPATARRDASLDDQRVVLRLTNPLLNDVRLYDPLQNSGTFIVTGDAHPNTRTELDLSSLTFLLPIGNEPRNVYVAVRTSSSMVFSVVLEPVAAAIKSNRTYDLLAGLYLGLLVVFFVLAVFLRLGLTDRVTNLFIVQQALAIVWSLSLMGYTRQYLGELLGYSPIDTITNLVVIAYTFSVSLFAVSFLHLFKLKWWCRHLPSLVVIVFVPLVVLVTLGMARLALSINALTVIFFSIVGLLVVLFGIDWRSDTKQVLPRWLVTVFYVTLGFAVPLATSVTLRVEPIFQNAFVGFFFTTALTGALMSTLLLYRARVMAREAVSTATALKLQQQRSKEQAKFLGMLAHEFKTPLSIIKMVTSSGQLDSRAADYCAQAIRNMDALLEKCLQAEALMDSMTISQPVLLSIEALVSNVASASQRPEHIHIRHDGHHKIWSDPTLVRIILANLIDNAFKYGSPDVLVQVTINTSVNDGVSMSVSNGIGRAGTPDPRQVFDKYYRSPGALSQSGSGLGLYLSKQIAQMLGGDLTFRPNSSELVFELVLPRQISQRAK